MTPLVWLGRRMPPLRWILPTWLVLASVIAVVQQASAQRWPVVASVACFAAAVVLAPRWARHWQRDLNRLAADAVHTASLTNRDIPGGPPSTRPDVAR